MENISHFAFIWITLMEKYNCHIKNGQVEEKVIQKVHQFPGLNKPSINLIDDGGSKHLQRQGLRTQWKQHAWKNNPCFLSCVK